MCFAVGYLHVLELWITNLFSILTSSFPYEQIADSLCVGQRSPDGLEERVLLFLKMATGDVTPDLVRRLNSAIRSQLSAR
jgi:acetoacetyl-CoA synthetase